MIEIEYFLKDNSVVIKTKKDEIVEPVETVGMSKVPSEVIYKLNTNNGYYKDSKSDLAEEATTEKQELYKNAKNNKLKEPNPGETSLIEVLNNSSDFTKQGFEEEIENYIKAETKKPNMISEYFKAMSDISKELDKAEEVAKEDIEKFTKSEVGKSKHSESKKIEPSKEHKYVSKKEIEEYTNSVIEKNATLNEKIKEINSNIASCSNSWIEDYVNDITGSSNEEKDELKKESVQNEKENEAICTKVYDFVEAPVHYNGHKIITKNKQEFEYETIELIESWLRRHSWMPEEAKYAAGNGLKYYDRVGNKPEDGKTREEKAAEDFEKISWYALRAAKALRGELYRGN